MNNEIEHLAKLLDDFRFCQMVTIDGNGEMMSRPMTLQTPRNDAPIWFAATKTDVPGANLLKDPRVNLAFHRDSDHAWISMTGTAKVNTSARIIQDLWKDSWNIWFSDDNKEDVILLEIEPKKVTFWEPEKGQLAQFASIMKSKFTDSTIDFAPSKSLELSRKELSAAL